MGLVTANELSINDERQWTLVDDSHPIFNRWEHETTSGECYCECFFKYEDPNKQNLLFKDNPYLKRMTDLEIYKKDAADELGMTPAVFGRKLIGDPRYDPFTKEELRKLNKLLMFEDYGDKDVRVEINPELWGEN